MLVNIDWRAVERTGEDPGVPNWSMLRLRAEAAAELWPGDPEAARFATEVGVPFARGLFRLLPEHARRRPENPDRAFAREPLTESLVETAHGRLRQLGELFGGFVFVNLDDGTIWVCDPDSEVEYELIHGDVSSFSYLVYKVEVERPLDEERPTPYDWADAEEFVREGMARWDPLPFERGARFWEAFLDTWATM
ncbi:SUKH-4 family immunity protein [Kitasatospora sp. NPDC093806]|uniref:SUKH-4 family immunity protein n=1 Tax=Kitasatospora sp. NPDC093806 TaxID=3155075 RepID=UPI003421D24F